MHVETRAEESDLLFSTSFGGGWVGDRFGNDLAGYYCL